MRPRRIEVGASGAPEEIGGGPMVKRSRLLAVLLSVGLVAAACGRSDEGTTPQPPGTGGDSSGGGADPQCRDVTLEATEIGVTEETITIQVMADTGSPLAPGLFQGNVDALEAFESFVNDNGGIACRELVVESWDSKLTPEETKNGQINACSNALALVGGNSLFNPDVSAMNTCVDGAGQPTGLPNVAALANDINEQCSPNTYSISPVPDTCLPGGGPPTGVRQFDLAVGAVDFALTLEPELRGLYMIPGDLPTTVQSATTAIAAQASAGVDWVETVKVSGRSEQSAYTPLVQLARAGDVNYVYDGSNDVAMINMRREAAAQSFDPAIWMCSIACYTERFKTSSGVDGTYLGMPFLPFEDEGSNTELDNYLGAIETPDSFGAQAWMAAVLFRQAIDDVVGAEGPNAITRASLLDALSEITSFDANGWAGARDPKGGPSDCQVMMRLEGGEFVRLDPEEKGTFHCDPGSIVQVTLDPTAEAAKIQ
jgi:hypothetical protein